ncbi:MAG: triose-phosphate isomerase [Zoogloeaceae bacterium]|jgi:triosephosphate isomerase|nr:triose-phosphate isomerase [Zoogloeaceae bacterium]
MFPSRLPLVAANWKMNGSRAENAALLAALLPALAGMENREIVLFAPYPYLGQVAELLAGSKVALGAQNVNAREKGAFTGEVSAAMLRDVGCRYVLVGHSERRTLFHESDAEIAEKWMAAKDAGLSPVLCLGETLAEREAGKSEEVVARQLEAVLHICGVSALRNAVLAYEPVWAIGSGRTASPEDAARAHRVLRARVAKENADIAAGLRVVYGGSVRAENAARLFAPEDVDGGLIGGASLDAAEFAAICRAAVF